jgi:predicted deacylase
MEDIMPEKKGVKEHGWLTFKYRNTGEPIRFPVGTVYGETDGPTLLVLGGMHGSEFAGIEAAIRLFNEVDPKNLKGVLKVGMIYNVLAFENNLGFLVPHDGKNPMGTFPGNRLGTYGEAMAFYFNQEVLSKCDYFVELHGGDIPEALTPFVMHLRSDDPEVDEKSRRMAEVYNIPLVVKGAQFSKDNPPHNAFGTAMMRGAPSMLAESGQQGILKMEEVETHLTGLRNVMVHLGMVNGEIVNTVKRKFLENYTAIRSEYAGMWYPIVQLNQRVTTGEVVGYIRDYFGEPVAEIKAKLDGVVSMVRTSPAVKVGNTLIEHGFVASEES